MSELLLQEIEIREDDTEPLEIVVDAGGLADLSALTAATAYFRKVGEATNHINGAALTVVDSTARLLRLNPVGAKNPSGNAFDSPGTYKGHVRLTWTGGAITRHPGDQKEDLTVKVVAKFDP